MFASILSDTLVWGVKVAGRFILGASLMAAGIFGFSLATGAIKTSDLTVENARHIVSEIKAKAHSVTGALDEMSGTDFGGIVEAYKGNVGETYSGPDANDEGSDDYGSVDDWDGFSVIENQGSEQTGY